jgi:hypothetical protein
MFPPLDDLIEEGRLIFNVCNVADDKLAHVEGINTQQHADFTSIAMNLENAPPVF